MRAGGVKHLAGIFTSILIASVWPIPTQQLGAAQANKTRPQLAGSVQGLLLDDTGRPAKGFSISIVGTSHASTYRVEAKTDANGNFAADDLKYGSYLAAPHLDTVDSRYPPGTSAFFDKHLVRLSLSQDSPRAAISVTLDPPCLIISGAVTDSVARRPLLADLKMRHQDDKEKWVRFGSSATGKYRVWLPPGKAIAVEVSSPGYQVYRSVIPAIDDGVDPVLNVALAPLGANAE